MEEDQKPADPAHPEACANCGKPEYESGYITKLCKDCRFRLSHGNYPGWIKIFAASILALFLIGSIALPKNISAIIHFERGQKAKERKQYNTARNEFAIVETLFPNSIETISNLFVSDYFSEQIEGAIALFPKLTGKSIEDISLFNQVQEAMDEIDILYQDSAFESLLNHAPTNTTMEIMMVCDSFINAHPENYRARMSFADRCFDLNLYDRAEQQSLEILKKYPDFYIALNLMGAIYRERRDYNQARIWYGKQIENNVESISGITGLAKVHLKKKENREALEVAREACQINSQDITAMETLAMAYHFNKMEKERDEIVHLLKTKFPKNSAVINRLGDVISGKTIYVQ